MSAVCERLPWDSAFFGYPVARVVGGTMDAELAEQVLAWCRAEDTRFLYFLADDDVPTWAVACDSGFRLVDIRVEMMLDQTWPRLPAGGVVSGLVLREATNEDLDSLVPIAVSVHTDSRFFVDPAVAREKAHALFEISDPPQRAARDCRRGVRRGRGWPRAGVSLGERHRRYRNDWPRRRW